MKLDPSQLAKIQQVTGAFELGGKVTDALVNTTGHIHDTYVLETDRADGQRFALQRVNHAIFENVDHLMENIARVTGHIRGKLAQGAGDPSRGTLSFLEAPDGRNFCRTPQGECWRCYAFIEDVRTYDLLENGTQACEAARAFGRFQAFLADLPPPPLHDTIPHFHDTPRRLEALQHAIAADTVNRCADCPDEIAFALQREPIAGKIVRDLHSGVLPSRVTHNDCKVNNVLIDNETGEGVCVIDLDTVMPGSILYDFGDMVRTFTPTAEEDEPDLSRFDINLDIFRCLVKGYLQEAAQFLTVAEVENLVFAGRLLTYTIGIRFLTDYLSGDVYFRTTRPKHNLDRARTQFKLVRLIEENAEEMERIVQEAIG